MDELLYELARGIVSFFVKRLPGTIMGAIDHAQQRREDRCHPSLLLSCVFSFGRHRLPLLLPFQRLFNHDMSLSQCL
jgi:hypothetical protein